MCSCRTKLGLSDISEATKAAWIEWHKGIFADDIPEITNPCFDAGFAAGVKFAEESAGECACGCNSGDS